jgi:hypothetical protein
MKQIESFFWGIIAALGALGVEFAALLGYSFFTEPYGNFSIQAYFSIPFVIIGIAFIEELFKYLIITKRIELLSLERSFVVNSFLLGIGFAFTELFFIQKYNSTGTWTIQSLAEIALLHGATGAFIGYRIAIKNHAKFRSTILTLVSATIMHGLYNMLITIQNEYVRYIIAAYIILLTVMTISNLFKIKSRLAA